MITKDEENYLEQCLNSVKSIIDEIIVVDTGSKDKTKDIAKKFNAKIVDFKWADDFSATRNKSLEQATKEWILVFDADEVLEEKDCLKIKDLIKNAGKETFGFAFQQRSYIKDYFDGAMGNKTDFEPVKKYPFYILNNLVRLFRNNQGIHFRHRVHELVEDSIKEKGMKYEKTDVVLHHFGSVKDAVFVERKADMYSKIILRQVEDNPESARYNYQAARMFIGKKDFANAIAYFEKTAEIDATYKLPYSEIAKIYLRINDKEKALEYFKKSMDRNPDKPSPANNLAVMYMSIGKFKQAKEILEEELKKHPNNPALKRNYEDCLKNI
ncbi:MAG TPA: glycosyltransferase [Candidatus Nanoarchaeia archaeon]|nr:glycosyltransferase [Candidatus Nanoarchaeia archaeon]